MLVVLLTREGGGEARGTLSPLHDGRSPQEGPACLLSLTFAVPLQSLCILNGACMLIKKGSRSTKMMEWHEMSRFIHPILIKAENLQVEELFSFRTEI